MSGLHAANVKRSVAMKARRNGKKARKAPEARLQESVCQYLALQERCGRLLWFAVPNGGSRNLLEAVNLKRQGLRAGVPDLCIIPKVGPVCFIELKSEDGVVSKLQGIWMQNLTDYGCPVRVCRSLEEVQQFLFETGVIREVA
jgi:hypothetical protein